MKKMTYNELNSLRIKSIFLGVMIACVNAMIIYLLSIDIMNLSNTSISSTISLLSIASLGIGFVSKFIPFNRVIETINGEKFVTYYQLGWLKLKLKTFSMPAEITIEQDSKRYYCILIKFSNQQALFIERYPTLDNASARLAKLRTIFI